MHIAVAILIASIGCVQFELAGPRDSGPTRLCADGTHSFAFLLEGSPTAESVTAETTLTITWTASPLQVGRAIVIFFLRRRFTNLQTNKQTNKQIITSS
jgi:hypothetical protein